MIIIKDLVKKEKKFPKGTIFAFMFLWTVIISIFGIILSVVTNIFLHSVFNNEVTFMIILQIITTMIGSVLYIAIAQLSDSIVMGKGQNLSIAFQVLTNPKIFKRMLTMILSYIIIFIGLVLFIVPGIILAYAFGLVPFILIDEDYQSLSAVETLKKSYELMKENKIKMFLLQLRYFLPLIVGIIVFSFMLAVFITFMVVIFLYVVGILVLIFATIGIFVLTIYISSKYYIALAIFYKQIKEEQTLQSIEEV